MTVAQQTAARPQDLCDEHARDPERVRRALQELPKPGVLHGLVETFKVLGSPTRLSILSALSRTELCVCDIAALLEDVEQNRRHEQEQEAEEEADFAPAPGIVLLDEGRVPDPPPYPAR